MLHDKWIYVLCLCLILGLLGCTRLEDGDITGEIEPGTDLTDSNDFISITTTKGSIAFYEPPPLRTFSCECPSGPMSLDITDEWVKAHTPSEIAMVFSTFAFIVYSNLAADYSEICCSVLRKLEGGR